MFNSPEKRKSSFKLNNQLLGSAGHATVTGQSPFQINNNGPTLNAKVGVKSGLMKQNILEPTN